MMKQKLFPSLVAVPVIALLVLTGCTQKPAEEKPTKDDKTTSEEKQLPEDPKNETKKDLEFNLEVDELERAQKAYPDAEATEHMTKEQVQIALLNMTEYRDTAFVDGALLGSHWADEGFSYDALLEKYGKNWNTNYQEYMSSYIEAFKAKAASSETTIEQEQEFHDLFSQLPIIYTSAMTKRANSGPICADLGDGAYECLAAGGIVIDGETTYATFSEDAIQISTKFQLPLMWMNEDVKGIIPINYNQKFNFVKNPSADPIAGHPSFILDSSESSFEVKPFVADKE